MSGIVTLFHPDGRPVDRDRLSRMVAAMPHRGPDGTRIVTEGEVGMGHQMLHTTPESLQEVLPAKNAAGTLLLTSDARIDNREALLATLGLRGETPPDSALILAAYERWGEDLVEHLVGDFAFALWDAPRRTLLCVRDHLGVRNLYYHHAPGLFACASEIKALLAHPEIPEEIDEVQIGAHATGKLLDSERTVFRGILRVLPGHLLKVTPHGLTSREYWSPRPTDQPLPTTDEGYAAEFLDLFQEAVRVRMRSAFPVASELSGGLDSSLVTCVARDLQGSSDPLRTISLVYDRFPESDERTYIEEVVAQGGIAPHYEHVEEYALLELLDEIFGYLDDGRVAGNHHLNWLTAKAANGLNARVLLTGQDGDTTVYHGWQYFIELARAGEWERFVKEAELSIQNLRREQGAYAMQETFTGPRDVLNAYAGTHLVELARRREVVPLLRSIEQIHKHFGVARREMYRRFGREFVRGNVSESQRREVLKAQAKQAVPRVLSPDLVARIGLEERLMDHLSETELPTTVREAQRQTLSSSYLHYSFEKFEQYTAAWGVEGRHPFMDKRLVEYCLALPPEQSYSEGWTRVVMRRAMEGVVPDRIRYRVGKTDLAPPYRYLLLHKGAETLADTVSQLGDKDAFLDVSYLTELYERKDALTGAEVRDLGAGLTLARWLDRRHQADAPDNEPVPPVLEASA